MENYVKKYTREWVVTVRHDKGKTRIRTIAMTAKAAIDKVIAAEGCPESAIVEVKLS